MSATASSTEARPTDAGRRDLLVSSIRLDAVMSGAAGLLLAAGATLLDRFLGAPIAFLLPVGIFLLAYAAALTLIAKAGAPPRVVAAVVAGNAVWAVASVVAVLADWLTLTTAGTALTLVQAAAVALVAELQLLGLRRARQSETMKSVV